MNCPKCGTEAMTLGCRVTDQPFHWCPQCGSIKPCDDSPWAEPAGHAALAASHARLLAASKLMQRWLYDEGGWSDALEEKGINAAIAQAPKEPT